MIRPILLLFGLTATGTLITAADTAVPFGTVALQNQTVPATTLITSVAPSSTPFSAPKDISIPLSVIKAAPLIDHPAENTTFIPIVGSDNSTLVAARPDLQDYVDSMTLNTSLAKRSELTKRDPSGYHCASGNTPSLNQDTWNAIASYICTIWYPIQGQPIFDPSSPYPNTLKSTTIHNIGIGNGQVINLDFSYGVNDWSTQAIYHWQPFYLPQSQSICIADIKTLIAEMFGGACLYHVGYDTSGFDPVTGTNIPFPDVYTGTGQPKWYRFRAY